MTYEYSGDPSTSSKDAVRFLLHDTTWTATTEPLLQDEEIEWLLTQNTNVYLAAANGAETISAQFRKSATQSKSVGGLSISYSNRSDEYASLAALLRQQAGSLDSSIPTPLSTAQSVSEKAEREADEDRNATPFKLGIHDNQGTGAYAG